MMVNFGRTLCSEFSLETLIDSHWFCPSLRYPHNILIFLMATPSIQTKCSISPCDETNTYPCRGCSKEFCFHHLIEHRLVLKEQLSLIQDHFNQFRQNLIDMKNNSQKHPLIKQIDQWENESIRKVKEKANQYRQLLNDYTKESINQIEMKLNETNQFK